MATSLKNLIKDRMHFTTTTFACVAIFLLPLFFVATGFNFSPPTASIPVEASTHLLPVELPSAESTLQLRGGLIARADNHAITEVTFTLGNRTGAEPINLTNDFLTIAYRDPHQHIAHLAWSKQFLGQHNNDNWLEADELVQITIPLAAILSTNLGPNTPFVINVKPPHGEVLKLQRTTPKTLHQLMDLS